LKGRNTLIEERIILIKGRIALFEGRNTLIEERIALIEGRIAIRPYSPTKILGG